MDSIKDMNFKPIYIHPEEEPIVDEINNNIKLINDDLNYIDNTIINIASNFNSLMENTKLKLKNIKDLINLEKERQEDINILCNKYSDFSSVINLNADSFNGDLLFKDNILTGPISNSSEIKYDITDIVGNGQPGNSYVYQNDAFISDTLDTANRSNINDNNLNTYYEYSRLTINNSDEAPLVFNKDSIEAECSIIITADDNINYLVVNSDRDDLILKEVYISNDGYSYTLDKEYNTQINKIQDKYINQDYIYGSGIIAVPLTKYVKLCFKSNGYTDETLAYIKAFNDNNSITKRITKVFSAKRHVIKINDLKAYRNIYKKGTSVSKELITDQVKFIGLCCNEYTCSDNSIEDLVKYYLIINGVEYEIVPINSQRNGKKIIRTSSQTYQLDNTEYIKESIKSAKLKIVISSYNNVTPYISNIKLLIGGIN